MRNLLAFVAASLVSATSARAEPPRRADLTVTREGNDLRVTVDAVTDYCSTNADVHILRSSDAIRILQDRPSRVSRCISVQQRQFVVKDVGPGRYLVSFERMPLVAPARPIRVAWANVAVQ